MKSKLKKIIFSGFILKILNSLLFVNGMFMVWASVINGSNSAIKSDINMLYHTGYAHVN